MGKSKLLFKGNWGTSGKVIGIVRVVDYMDPSQVAMVKPGEILVSERTIPSTEEAMNKAAGIITNAGGKTSHTMIQSKILGKTAVVGTVGATSELKTGQMVLVDGDEKSIYEYLPEVGEAVGGKKSLSERMAEIAARSGKTSDAAALLEKMKKRGL